MSWPSNIALAALLLPAAFAFQGCTKVDGYYLFPLGYLHYEYDRAHTEEKQVERLEKKEPEEER